MLPQQKLILGAFVIAFSIDQNVLVAFVVHSWLSIQSMGKFGINFVWTDRNVQGLQDECTMNMYESCTNKQGFSWNHPEATTNMKGSIIVEPEKPDHTAQKAEKDMQHGSMKRKGDKSSSSSSNSSRDSNMEVKWRKSGADWQSTPKIIIFYTSRFLSIIHMTVHLHTSYSLSAFIEHSFCIWGLHCGIEVGSAMFGIVRSMFDIIR